MSAATRKPRQRKLHLTLVGDQTYQFRYDPTSAAPDFIATSLGAACHLTEFGHPQAVGCCPYVDRNGRHLLPRFRQS